MGVVAAVGAAAYAAGSPAAAALIPATEATNYLQALSPIRCTAKSSMTQQLLTKLNTK